MTTDSPRADVEEMVRQYYAAKGWPDELWAMGFEEAVKFAEHFRREAATLLSQEHARAERLEAELNRRKGDPVTRLHNLCEAVEDPGPFTMEARERLEKELEEVRKGANWLNTFANEEKQRLEARAEQLERLLSEADEVIEWRKHHSLLDVPPSRIIRWGTESRERHASRASPKQKE